MNAATWTKKGHYRKKNKNIFINVIGDKFIMCIRSRKLIISFVRSFSVV